MLTPEQERQLTRAIDDIGIMSIQDLERVLHDFGLDLRVWIDRRRVFVALTDSDHRQANANGDAIGDALACALTEYRDRCAR